jgi:hypothetical protein
MCSHLGQHLRENHTRFFLQRPTVDSQVSQVVGVGEKLNQIGFEPVIEDGIAGGEEFEARQLYDGWCR